MQKTISGNQRRYTIIIWDQKIRDEFKKLATRHYRDIEINSEQLHHLRDLVEQLEKETIGPVVEHTIKRQTVRNASVVIETKLIPQPSSENRENIQIKVNYLMKNSPRPGENTLKCN